MSGYAAVASTRISSTVGSVIAPVYLSEAWQKKLLAHSVASHELFRITKSVIKALPESEWRAAVDAYAVDIIQVFEDMVAKVFPEGKLQELDQLKAEAACLVVEVKKYRKHTPIYRAHWIMLAINRIRRSCGSIFDAVGTRIETELHPGTAQEMMQAMLVFDSFEDSREGYSSAVRAAYLLNDEIYRLFERSRRGILLKRFQDKELFNTLDFTTSVFYAMYSKLAGCLFDKLYDCWRLKAKIKNRKVVQLLTGHELAHSEMIAYADEYSHRFREVKMRREATRWFTDEPSKTEVELFRRCFERCRAMPDRHVILTRREKESFSDLAHEVSRLILEGTG